MHTLWGTASKIQTIHDGYIFHTDQSVDVARAVHLMFTELHEECLTEEHYYHYHIVSECLRAMKEKFDKMLPTADQKLRNFIANSRLMWNSWNEIVPLPKVPFIYDY